MPQVTYIGTYTDVRMPRVYITFGALVHPSGHSTIG